MELLFFEATATDDGVGWDEQQFHRAGHVVRLGPRIRDPIDPDLVRNPTQTLITNDDRPLLMDYYPRGSLEKVLYAAAARGKNGERIYDRTLWCMFDCGMCGQPDFMTETPSESFVE